MKTTLQFLTNAEILDNYVRVDIIRIA